MLRLRYTVDSWVAGERDQAWKALGVRRARSVAEHVIREYRERGVGEFEVMISENRRGVPMVDFYSSKTGEWQGPTESP
jgi:hypothetical protein